MTHHRPVSLISAIVLLAAAPAVALGAYTFESAFGSPGTAAGQFNAPRAVAIDTLGRIVVTESGSHRVQLCSYAGNCIAWGGFGVESGQFDRPRGVVVRSDATVFVADRGNDRIQDCSYSGICTDFGGSGTVVGKFESPRGVALTADGRIVVTDTDNDRVQVCADTGVCTAFGSSGANLGQFSSPAGVAVNSQGKVIVADRGNHRIQICNLDGSACSAFGSLGSAPGQFDSPAGVAVDSQDRIVIVDRFNDRIQVCTSAGVCTAFGSTGGANGQFNLPWGVTVDPQDRIIVADLGNNRVQIFADDTAAPTVSIDSFSANPLVLDQGQSTELSWSVTNADECTPSGGTAAWSASVIDPVSGSTSIVMDTPGDTLFTLNCTNATSSDERSVTVTANERPLTINAGLNDAWYNPATAGQGFFVNVYPQLQAVFVAWFTYEVTRPAEDVAAVLGEPGHRWLTAFGAYSGDTANIQIEFSDNGVFRQPLPPDSQYYDGTMRLEFHDCRTATITYDMPSRGLSGSVPVQRLTDDNVALCERLGYPEP